MYGPEERVIPFNRGIEFFPDARSSRHRQGAHDSAGLNPPSPQLAHSSLFPPQRKRKRREKERGWPHPPSSPPPRTIILQWSRRVARGNCSPRWRRADETSAMKLSLPPPIHLPPPPLRLSLPPPVVRVVVGGKKMQEQGGGGGGGRGRREKKREKKIEGGGGGGGGGSLGISRIFDTGGWPRLILLSVCARRRKKALPRGCD